MQQKLRIIMSAYYAEGHNEDISGADLAFTMRLDLTQALLAIEGIFDYEGYKYSADENGIVIEPYSQYQDQLNSMIDASRELFAKRGILLRNNAGKAFYEETEYKKVIEDVYLKEAQNNLYHFSCLFSNINRTNSIEERNSLLYYMLFGNRDGKEFLSYLTSMLVRLVVICCIIRNKKQFIKFIESINYDYDIIQKLFRERGAFLLNLRARNNNYRVQNNEFKVFFVNSFAELNNWVKRKETNAENSLLDFVFDNNIEGKKKAKVIISQFVRIFNTCNGDERLLLKWDTGDTGSVSVANSYRLDELVKKAEKGEPLNYQWYEAYLREIDMFTKQIRATI